MKFKDYLSLDEVLITFGGKRPKYNNVVILAGGAGCFTEDTLVQTSKGLIKIKDIDIGDEVLSFNEFSKTKEFKEVQNTYIHEPNKQMIELTLEDGSIIRCTEDHKFLVGGSWIQAKNLSGQDIDIKK